MSRFPGLVPSFSISTAIGHLIWKDLVITHLIQTTAGLGYPGCYDL